MGRKRGKKRDAQIAGNDSAYDLDNGQDAGSALMQELSLEKIRSVITTSRYVQVLLLLTAAGLFLRFYHLDFNSIWLDEGSTLGIARHSFIEIWQITAGGENNPPLFHWMEHFMLIFGESEFVLRFLPALLGGLTIPLFYLAGKEFIDRNVGILAAALLTFSPFHIYYSQDARAYTTMLFFTTLAMLFYFRGLKSEKSRDWVAFGAFSALAFWAHFYAFIPAFVIILHALITRRHEIRDDVANARNIAVSAAAFLILTIPLIIVTIGLFFKTTDVGATFGYRGFDLVISTISQISYFDIYSSGLGIFITILFLVVFAIGCTVLYRISPSKLLFILLYIGIPIIISILLAPVMPMVPRYLIYLLPAYFIGISMAYRPICDICGTKKAIYAIIAVIFIISVPFFAPYYTTFSKNDWRGFSDAIQETTADGDYVVLVPGYMSQPFNYYYDNASDHTFQSGASKADTLQTISDQGKGRKIYYIVTGDIFSADPQGSALAWLEQNSTFAGRYMGIHLYVSG